MQEAQADRAMMIREQRSRFWSSNQRDGRRRFIVSLSISKRPYS
jgi:hypothetical protein